MDPTGRTRILVVDDEEVVLAGIERILKRDGVLITKATSAEMALELLKEEDIDIVIADLKLPGMDGLELLTRLRETAPGIPTILITGFATIKSATQALKIGAVEYLPKPFTKSELRGAVYRAARRNDLPIGSWRPPTESERASSPLGTSATLTTPGQVYRLPEHTWVRIDEDSICTVGMDRVCAQTIRRLIRLDLPVPDEEMEQGRSCLEAVDGEGIVHSLCSPLSGRVVEVNGAVIDDMSLALEDPERDGWLFRLEPRSLEEELPNLLPD
jgi:CheY-like chemotaxis protein/glycine cleavage system H lipoate-binding protein